MDWILISILNFLYWSIAGKLLQPKEYGVASTTINFIIVLSGITLLGLNMALQKLIPEYQSRKKMGKIYGIIKFSLKIFLVTNILMSILIFVATPILAEHVFKSDEMKKPLYLSAFILPFSTFATLSYSIIFGFQNMRTVFISDFLGNLVKNIISAILIILNFSYFGPIMGFLMNGLLVSILRIKKILISTPIKSVNIDKKELFSYAIPGLVGLLCALTINQSSYLIVSSLSTIEATGIFTLAFILASPIYTIPQNLAYSSFPVLSQLFGKKDIEGIRKVLSQMFRYSLLITLPSALVMIVFPVQMILILSNPSYVHGSSLLQILVMTNMILGIGNFFLTSLYSLGKPKITRNVQICQALIFLVLSFILVPKYSFMGMGYTYIGISVFTFLVGFMFIKRFYGIDIELSSVMKNGLASLFFVSFLYWSKQYIEGIFEIFFIVMVGGCIYFVSLLIMKFFTEEDLEWLIEVKMKSRKLKFFFAFLEKIIKKFVRRQNFCKS